MLVVVVSIITLLLLFFWYQREPTSQSIYEQATKMLKTEGTQVSTVNLWSKDNRKASGTLIKNGTTEIVITVAHFFSIRNPDTEFWYTVDDQKRSITSVFPHPKSSSSGEKDIAFCLPGKSKSIKNFWQLERDEVYLNPKVQACVPFDVRLLKNNQVFAVLGTVVYDNKDPLYIIPRITVDGESGSGLIALGRFFVIKGNITSSSLDLHRIFGVNQSNLTLVTEM